MRPSLTIIDTKAPLLHAGNFSGFSKMKDDIQTFRERHKTNAQLLVRMNEIFRLKGVTDCFRTKETAATPSSIPRRIKEMEKIESTNMILVSIKEVCPVGRLVIHLHTEAAPAVVLELMRLCGNHHNNSLSFVKIFPSLWLEAQLQLGDKTMLCRTLEYDKRALDHGNYAGVLSFSLDHLNLLEEDKETSLMFAISFRPLGLLNGRRVGFGHVIEGLDILNFIQAYGTKNGKPTKEFVVSKCGVFVN
uniref:PPIase cyclophilin-type domain-containing protein n=1 Tax=Stomoxys calcitrans TaxID=35570 RepID=A0A1I8NXG0_STOCA